MLDTYFKPENIDCEYKCESCKRKTSITKSIEICVLPPILVFEVKRFTGMGKHNGEVIFPDMLDIKSYVSDDFERNKINEEYNKSTNYELISVSEHIGGSLNSGHYIAFSKREGKWYRFNDSSYCIVSEDDAKSKSAYMIFYRRVV